MAHVIPLLIVSVVFLATACSFVSLYFRTSRLDKVTQQLTGLAIFLNSTYYFSRIFQQGYVPFSATADSFFFFSWAILVLYLLVEYWYGSGGFGTFILPLALFTSVYGLLSPAEVTGLLSSSKGVMLVIHASCAFLGFAAFAITCAIAAMYLVQERQLKSKHTGTLFHQLPALTTLDTLGYRLLQVGFPLLTVSVLSGILWSGTTRASYFDVAYREVWFLIIWILYGILLQIRASIGWGGKKAAYWAITSFLLACLPLFFLS